MRNSCRHDWLLSWIKEIEERSIAMHHVKAPTWFWIAAVVTLLWSLVGVASYVADVTMTEEALRKLPEAQQQVYDARPAWVVGVYAVAVFAALAGSIALLLRRRVATTLFAISLLAVVIQFASVFTIGAVAALGWSAAIFPAFIAIAGGAMLQLAKSAAGRGWIV
jgi:hypothetical protein